MISIGAGRFRRFAYRRPARARGVDLSRATPFTNCSRTQFTSARSATRRFVTPGQHDAILDRETWEEVQRRLRDQTARDGSRKSKLLLAFWRVSCSMNKANRFTQREQKVGMVAATGTMFLAGWSEAA